MKNPFIIFSKKEDILDEWVTSALVLNKEFRREVFSLIARHIEKGNQIQSFGWNSIISQMPQELRDELFVYCYQARGIGRWCDSFRDVVGRETQGIVFDKNTDSAEPYFDAIEEDTTEADPDPQIPFNEFDEGPYFDEFKEEKPNHTTNDAEKKIDYKAIFNETRNTAKNRK